MKKLIILAAVFFSFLTVSAQNTFPTSGNVGIGTTSPTTPLFVKSNYDAILTLQTNDNSWLYTNWLDNTGTRRLWMGLDGSLSSFQINVQNGTNKIIFNGGNVGIGTTNPLNKLQVNGGVYLNSGTDFDNIYWAHHNLDMGTRPGSYNHNILNLKPGGASQGLLHTQLNMYVANSQSSHVNKVRIHSNGASFFNGGNIGIGTENPNAKLDVNGNIQVTSPGSSWITGKTGTGGITSSTQLTGNAYHPLIRQKTASGHFINLGGLGDFFGFFGYDKDRTSNGYDHSMIMNLNTGNIGIGTTTPDSKLTVAGNIHSREVKVTVNAGADFVFDDAYSLPTLEEVQEFIEQNGHLPEIASAKDMKENGIHLSEMNIKLLQKIEELTLYTIEQEKKLKEQEEKIITMNEKLKKVDALEEKLNKLINK